MAAILSRPKCVYMYVTDNNMTKQPGVHFTKAYELKIENSLLL